MTKLKHILLSVALVLLLPGCQLLTSSVDIASSVILASDKVDATQSEVGEFSTNQEALAELDSLQADIKQTLTTGDNALYATSYQARALVIYATLKSEVKLRWGELSTEQQASLIALDNELISINDAINDMKSSPDFDVDIVDLVYRATILMAYYKGI